MTKKGGGKPGLGVKKLDTKVDDALFDQAPAPEAAPAPPASLSDPLLVGSGAASGGAGEAAARASRFSYDLVTAVSWGLGACVQRLAAQRCLLAGCIVLVRAAPDPACVT